MVLSQRFVSAAIGPLGSSAPVLAVAYATKCTEGVWQGYDVARSRFRGRVRTNCRSPLTTARSDGPHDEVSPTASEPNGKSNRRRDNDGTG